MTKPNKLAEKYLQEHGITEETAELFELTHDANYLNIPIKDAEGNDLFIKSRNLNYTESGDQPKYKNSQGSHATLFNLDAIADAPSVILTEGEIDTMRLVQEDFTAVSSTGGAGTFLPEFAEILKDKKVYICYDNDSAGRKGIRAVLELLPTAKIITLPVGKDVCEYFATGKTRADFVQLMRTARSPIEWKADNLPDEYKLLDGEEVTNRPITEVPYLINSILPAEGFTLIYGSEGIGKSLVALSLAIAVARGEDWLGIFKTPNKEAVLYLDKENSTSTITKRVKAMGGAPKNLYWLKSPEQFQLHDGKGGLSDFAQALTTLIEENHIKLIIVDSLVDLMVGNESSSQDTQLFFDAIRQLFPDIAILPLHHENKPAQGTYRTASQRVRGSTNINAQATCMFRIEAVAKSKTEITMQQTKNRNEQKLDKFMLRMLIEFDPNNKEEEKKTIVTGFEYMGIVADSVGDSKSEEVEELIKDALSEELNLSMSRKTLVAIASEGGVSETTVDRVLKSMEECKIVSKIRRGKEVWIRLDDPIVGKNELVGGLFED